MEIAAGRGLLAVEAAYPGAPLEAPLYAVNLLNRRRPWAYNLYGLLAVPAARRAGARLFFRGSRQRILAGREVQTRETLLIVRYPTATAFLDMVTRPYFAAISRLRELGLEDFLFGLTTREGKEKGWKAGTGAAGENAAGEEAWLLYTSRIQETADTKLAEKTLPTDLGVVAAAAVAAGLRPAFAGRLAGTLTVRPSAQAVPRSSSFAPPLPWQQVLLLAGREAELEAFYHGPAFEPWRWRASQAAAALYRRG